MALLAYRNLTVAFGGPPVLNRVNLVIDAGERICLVGRNGEGKSTLLRLIQGIITPDDGETERTPGLKVASLEQEVPTHLEGTVFDVVAEGLGESTRLLRDYHRAMNALAAQPDDAALANRVDTLQHALDTSDGWSLDHRVESLLTKLDLPGDADFASLSGGMKRRTLLARALANEPDILLLDEPTNHLDLPSIRWLEQFLLKLEPTVIFVSHDRAFVRLLAQRVLDLDCGRLSSWDCGFDTYLERKEAWLEAENKQQAVFDKKLAQEEVWIRQGIKARRTRNEGRVRALEALRRERASRRERQGTSSLRMQEASTSGQKVIVADGVDYAWGDQPCIRNFNTTIWKGDKIGIVGPNGSGKSTLLRLLLGELSPQGGTIRHGTRLQIAYFDQHRAALDEKLTLAENVSPHSDTVTFNGKSRHILSYLQDFLFSPATSRAPVKRLSGGERARVLLARLFLQPANLLVMDEPTNDLDIETVELIEDLLVSYPGTLLLVSHDRAFLDNVVTSTLVLEGDGEVHDYVGGCQTWLDTFEKPAPAQPLRVVTAPAPAAKPAERPRPLSKKEREELAALPRLLESLEAEQAALIEAMARPDHFSITGQTPSEAAAALTALEKKTEATYQRWESLEARADE